MGIFNKQSKATSQYATTTVIAKGCNITGEFQLACDIQVDGIIEGKLRIEKNLVVSKSGRLKGEIYADKIIVNGLIEGTCYANAIEIIDNGKISGTIYCDNLSIEQGGKFFGSTHPAEKEQVVELTPKGKAETKSVKKQIDKKASNE
ncbi:bactofilin family protein [Photobacterium chitinilyticum]|uniref:Polymer-forming cytoskeletal protein n=1 Tax=Photobacterium chitinilyticum TaxID=2485123 RepID=A0A444JSH2_9GAMM|nr:polymer-forming cytoskeletal protein [Photobacterium chitinilyticum]RWX56003.1 polymer-forming cytoskeletal protein [Photobacterium chitinilyticum]